MPYILVNTNFERGDYFMEKSDYLEPHPWIDFTLDTRGAGHRFWMLLGEAQSKCRHIAGVPLSPEVAVPRVGEVSHGGLGADAEDVKQAETRLVTRSV